MLKVKLTLTRTAFTYVWLSVELRYTLYLSSGSTESTLFSGLFSGSIAVSVSEVTSLSFSSMYYKPERHGIAVIWIKEAKYDQNSGSIN